MLKSILVGLDGSPHSKVALDLGIRWAKRFDALLVGLGIVDVPAIGKAVPLPVGAAVFQGGRDDALVADARRRVEQFLEQFSLRCAEQQVASKVLEEFGSAVEQIGAQAHRFDLVLLGRRTYFQVEADEWPDQTLQEVLKTTPRPVVTVPDSLRDGRCVMVACDGSLQAARTLLAFQASGLDEGRDVQVVSVAANHADAVHQADRAAEFLRYHDIKALPHPVTTHDAPAKVLLDQVRKLDPGLLVMGVYGKPTWQEFFFGSVTQSFLKASPVPMFLFH